MLSHAAFVNVLKTRYDHYSSPIMAKEILAGAGLEPKDSYEKADIERLVEVVKGLGDARNGLLVSRLEELAAAGGGGKAAQKAEAAERAAEKAAEEKAEEAPAAEEKAEEAPAEEKAEEHGDKKGKKKK